MNHCAGNVIRIQKTDLKIELDKAKGEGQRGEGQKAKGRKGYMGFPLQSVSNFLLPTSYSHPNKHIYTQQ